MSNPFYEQMEPMVVLSTAHLTKETMDRLNGGADVGFTHYPFEHGVMVYVPDDEYDAPEDLRRVLDLAAEYDIVWVRFDKDAGTVDFLPTWEW